MIVRPYDEDALPTYEWIYANVRLQTVLTASLRPTQQMLDLERLLALHGGGDREGPDPHPHVVLYEGELWIHDGHHGWVLKRLRGESTIEVRIVVL